MARNLTTGLQRGLRRSIAGGLGASDLFSIASLDLRFAQTKALDNRITFTRASSGTYVGSDGLIKTATTNLLLRSEEFGTTWINTALIIGTAATQAPNGSVTGTSIVPTTASAIHRIQQSISITAGTIYTASVYAKANGYNYLYLNAQSPFAARATFNLATGAISAIGSGTATMVAVGNGWYRCSVTGTAVSTQTSGPFFQVNSTQTGATDDTYTGDGTSGIYLWGAQLEQSSTVGEYIPTTSTINSAPRFDHNPTTGESLGLLVEEQRTNLCLQSQAISTSPWAPNGSETCVASTLTDPAGGTSAFKINFGGTGSFERWQQSISVVSGTTYTLSAWVRSTTGTTLFRLRFAGGVTSSDLTATTTWQRFSFTLTAGTTAGAFAFNAPSSGAAAEIHVWGAQLEAGSFPTSYIPTTTATVTRSADVASITGANFSSWYNQTEGTVFANAVISGASTETGIVGLTNAGETDFLRVSRLQTTSRPRSLVFDDSAAQADTQPTNTISAGQAFKLATVLKQNDFSTVLDGGSAAVDTSGTMPTVDRMTIGTGAFLTQLNGTIRRLTYWPSRLPNATLQSITT